MVPLQAPSSFLTPGDGRAHCPLLLETRTEFLRGVLGLFPASCFLSCGRVTVFLALSLASDFLHPEGKAPESCVGFLFHGVWQWCWSEVTFSVQCHRCSPCMAHWGRNLVGNSLIQPYGPAAHRSIFLALAVGHRVVLVMQAGCLILPVDQFHIHSNHVGPHWSSPPSSICSCISWWRVCRSHQELHD